MILLLCLLLFSDNGTEATLARAHHRLDASGAEDFGELVVAAGRAFRNAPYQGGTLERNAEEALVVELGAFDCVTLIESALALARTHHLERESLAAFSRELQRIRYRDGEIDGYPSRLHYTTDWIRDNQARGHVRDITATLGGIVDPRPIDFMSTHRGLYPHLVESDANHAAILEVEKRLADEPRIYLPKEKIASVERRIEEGDLLALTSSVPGLDFAHTGIATFVDGRLHMLHASSANGLVEVTRHPLADYMAAQKSQTGIVVFRPIAPAH